MTDEPNAAASVNTDTASATILTTDIQTPQGDAWKPPEWAKDVPAEHHALLKAKNYGSPADVVVAYANAQKALSGDKIPVPKDGVWDADSRKKLGIPDKPEDYAAGLKKPELPEGMKWDETFEKAALPVAHELGLTPKQLQGLMGLYAGYQAEQFKATMASQVTAAEETSAALRDEFGPQFDARLAQARRVVQQLGGPEVAQALNETGAGNNPHLVKMFAKIGAMMGEDQLKSGASGAFGMGTEEAKVEINKMLSHPARLDRQHPEHSWYLDKMAELQKIANPVAA
jgi:hypothetical protein